MFSEIGDRIILHLLFHIWCLLRYIYIYIYRAHDIKSLLYYIINVDVLSRCQLTEVWWISAASIVSKHGYSIIFLFILIIDYLVTLLTWIIVFDWSVFSTVVHICIIRAYACVYVWFVCAWFVCVCLYVPMYVSINVPYFAYTRQLYIGMWIPHSKPSLNKSIFIHRQTARHRHLSCSNMPHHFRDATNCKTSLFLMFICDVMGEWDAVI